MRFLVGVGIVCEDVLEKKEGRREPWEVIVS